MTQPDFIRFSVRPIVELGTYSGLGRVFRHSGAIHIRRAPHGAVRFAVLRPQAAPTFPKPRPPRTRMTGRWAGDMTGRLKSGSGDCPPSAAGRRT